MITKISFTTILLGASTIALFAQKTLTSPNVLFIYADDLGYADLSCTGSSFYETPNIDRLAEESVVFSKAYAACPVSSPSRAALMTGKYPARLNLTDYIPGNQVYGPHKDQMLSSQPFKLYIDPEETTIAEAFLQNGYTTFMVGKWHLGEKEMYYPEANGFEINIGGNKTGHPAGGYFSPYKNPQMKDGPVGEYLTDRLTDELIRYLETPKEKPFFAYLSYYTVHLPLQAKQEKIRKYEKKLEQMRQKEPRFILQGNTYHKQQQDIVTYAAMVESLDENVGRVLQALKKNGLDENTIVVFTSDNGGMATSNQTGNIPTSNYPLRAGKGYLYEGGIKVPAFIRWKGHFPAGRECVVPVTGTDYYPTLLDLCGLKLLPEQHLDGVSLKPVLLGGHISREAIYWHYPHYSGGLGGRPSAAIRSANYKLVEFFEDGHVELYDLKEDVSEQNNLSEAMPWLVNELKEKLHRWQKEVNALMPVKNPYYEQ
ncbi:sulfatase [Parabacteroides goldsteinii]|uniref:sulfatase n=1 Tax=Parabacteroides goldsteinii TaxID=328812 RepID=UPI00101D2A89|nr:sulfatase [Parabacteroides goldsteinii]